jgi:glucose/arabinose dehydrogenase
VSEDNPNLADPNSERIVLEVDQPQMNHNGGAIAFSPKDGYLYIALGDGGAADDVALGHPPIGHGQDITTLLGDILRIDVDRGWPEYAVPQDNPFVNREGADEIYAWGWRNPWRMSFDRGGNHDLFVTTNGQNLWEAVYLVDAPANYGWNILEGTHCFSTTEPNTSPESCERVGPQGETLRLPIIEYPHLANQGDSPIAGSSVTGGYVYRGSAIPELQGQYVFGDWSSAFDAPRGQLFVANPSGAGELWAIERLADLELFVLGFGEDAEGEIYVLTTENAGPAGDTGKVHKLVAGQ